jgi:hypothetical protein
MARRRYQRGHLFLRGKGRKVWTGKWREDVIQQDGSVRRVRKSEILGTLKEYKTRRLAERALQQRLAEVNSLTYKPRPTATFAEFAKKWQTDVLSQHKRSTQSADKSRIRKHLIPELGILCMKDISRELLQTFVARKAKILSPKSVRNLIALLGEMWVQARADGYTQLDPFVSLVLPDPDLINERCLTLDEMRLVIDSTAEPYKTYYWILAETGIRCGEACGLPARNLLLDMAAIKVDQKVWHGKIETVKSKKRAIVSAKFLRSSRSIFADTFAPGDRIGLGYSSPRATERRGTRTSFGSASSIHCSRSSGSSVAVSMLSATGTRP